MKSLFYCITRRRTVDTVVVGEQYKVCQLCHVLYKAKICKVCHVLYKVLC